MKFIDQRGPALHNEDKKPFVCYPKQKTSAEEILIKVELQVRVKPRDR